MRANRLHSGDTIPALYFPDRERGCQSWNIWIESCGFIYLKGVDWQELPEGRGNRDNKDVKMGSNFDLNHSRHAEVQQKALQSGSHCEDCLGLGLCTSLPWKPGGLSLSLLQGAEMRVAAGDAGPGASLRDCNNNSLPTDCPSRVPVP